MKIRLRSLAALSFLSLTLIACKSNITRPPQVDAAVENYQQDQIENEAADDLSNKSSIALDDEQTYSDNASTSPDMASWPDGQSQVDRQGAVEVAIVPVNLNIPQDTLEFEVSLNTHSLDLSMDLVALASLKTDTGLEVYASGWNGPIGGHHVSGILSFPSTFDGEAVLVDAMELKLTVVNLDVPEREFIWER